MLYVVYNKYGQLVDSFDDYKLAAKLAYEIRGYVFERIVHPW